MNTDTSPPEEDDPEPPSPDLVDVVDRTALIENLLNQIIASYCAPRKEAWEFMWSVVLDTSVMSLGAKAKVVMAIAQELQFKLKKDPLHRIIALRNAFAHHATNAHPVFVVGKTPEENRSYLQFWVLESSGKIQKLKRHEAFDEFNDQYRSARGSLVALRNLVREKVRTQ
jgi:hypothetical protein